MTNSEATDLNVDRVDPAWEQTSTASRPEEMADENHPKTDDQEDEPKTEIVEDNNAVNISEKGSEQDERTSAGDDNNRKTNDVDILTSKVENLSLGTLTTSQSADKLDDIDSDSEDLVARGKSEDPKVKRTPYNRADGARRHLSGVTSITVNQTNEELPYNWNLDARIRQQRTVGCGGTIVNRPEPQSSQRKPSISLTASESEDLHNIVAKIVAEKLPSLGNSENGSNLLNQEPEKAIPSRVTSTPGVSGGSPFIAYRSRPDLSPSSDSGAGSFYSDSQLDYSPGSVQSNGFSELSIAGSPQYPSSEADSVSYQQGGYTVSWDNQNGERVSNVAVKADLDWDAILDATPVFNSPESKTEEEWVHFIENTVEQFVNYKPEQTENVNLPQNFQSAEAQNGVASPPTPVQGAPVQAVGGLPAAGKDGLPYRYYYISPCGRFAIPLVPQGPAKYRAILPKQTQKETLSIPNARANSRHNSGDSSSSDQSQSTLPGCNMTLEQNQPLRFRQRISECDSGISSSEDSPSTSPRRSVEYSSQQAYDDLTRQLTQYGYCAEQLLAKDANGDTELQRLIRGRRQQEALTCATTARSMGLFTNEEFVTSNNGQTLLHLAVEANLPELVAYLLQCRMNPNRPCANGDTPLHLAASGGDNYERVVQMLCQHSHIKLGLLNNEGKTALHCAVQVHNIVCKSGGNNIISAIKIVQLLCHSGSPMSNSWKGYNPLHLAVHTRKLDLVKILSQYSQARNFDINQPTGNSEGGSSRRTALHLACYLPVSLGNERDLHRKVDIIRILGNYGACWEIRDNFNHTPREYIHTTSPQVEARILAMLNS